MAIMKFKGKVCGSLPRDDGLHTLLVQEIDLSEKVKYRLHDLTKDFDPGSHRLFKARNTPCPYIPGHGYYNIPLEADRIHRYPLGAVVDVEVEVTMLHNVFFIEKSGTWSTRNDLSFDLVKISNPSDKHSAQANDEVAPVASGAKGGK